MSWNPSGQGTKKREAMPASAFLDSKNNIMAHNFGKSKK